jgi:hypothetical protein
VRSSTSALVALALVACGNTTGGRCLTTSECQSGLVCVSTNVARADGGGDGARLCMRLCDYDAGNGMDQHLCSDGAACITIEGMRVCYLGGTHPIDTGCADDSQCEPGTVCASDTATCEQACTVGDDRPCGHTQSCVDVSGGVCRATMVVLDGGT